MREALIMLNIAHMVVIKPQSGTHVAPIDLKLMEMERDCNGITKRTGGRL